MVLRLRKSLYGLKQCSHVCYGTFKDFVVPIGFVASPVDRVLLVFHDMEDHWIVVAAVILYNDDLLIMANDGLIGHIEDQMKKGFRMHDLGCVSLYLGMITECNREHNKIDIHQHSYMWTILAMIRMDESRPVATPMAMKLHKRKPDEEACDPTIYRLMIGSLMYAMTATRPDIAYAIGVLSWYNHVQSNENMIPLKRVFRYLNGTKDWWLRFGGALREALGGALGGTLGGALPGAPRRAFREALEGESALRCYVNLDYAEGPDNYIWTSALVITIGGAVDWRWTQQKLTALSMTDAKYYPFGVGCMRLTQISNLLNELSIPTIPQLFSDSQSLIAIIENTIYRGTAVAHIATKYYLAADMARGREIDLSYVPTAEMLAHCFTRPLPKPAILKQCAAMGMIGIGLCMLGNGPRNCIGIVIGNGVGNAVWKYIEWA